MESGKELGIPFSILYYIYHGNIQLSPDAKGTIQVKSSSFKFSLQHIVMFTTGMPYEPPLGFIPQPSVSFTTSSAFPTANTCANVIHLPTKHTSLDQFVWHTCFGILNSAGFGLV